MPADEQSQSAYDVVLADLRAKRDQIDNAIKAIESLMSGTAASPTVATASPASVQPGMFLGHTVADAVRKILEIHKKPLGTRAIVDSLVAGGIHFSTATPLNSVQTILSRQSDIVKVGRGTWALASWYPHSGRFKKTKAGSDDGKPQSEPDAPPDAPSRMIEQTPDLKVVS